MFTSTACAGSLLPTNTGESEPGLSTHARTHTRTHTLAPSHGPFSPPHFNPKPNPLSPGEKKQTPSPTTPFATKTLRLPPSLPPAATTHTRARCKISGSALCTTKGNSSWKGLGRGGWEGREKKKKSPFPRGEPGERGNAACFSSLLSPHFLYFFLSLSLITPGGFCSLPGMAENPGPFLPASHPRLPRPFAEPPKLSAAISLPPRPPRHCSRVRTWSEGSSAGSLQAAAPPRAGPAGGSACPKFALKPGGCRGLSPSPCPRPFFRSFPRYFLGTFYF